MINKTKQVTTKQIADAMELNADFTIEDLLLNLYPIEMEYDALYMRVRAFELGKLITRVRFIPATYHVNDEQYKLLIELHEQILKGKSENSYCRTCCAKKGTVKKTTKKKVKNKWGERIIGAAGTSVTMSCHE